MINKIWGSFIVVGVLYSFSTGNIALINEEILNITKQSVEMTLKIFPVIALWLGISKIAEDSGLLNILSSRLSRVLKYIFPEIPPGHESLGYISSNIIANVFGLGSAATPFGLKAMNSLQSLNKKKDTASNSMITFLVLNTSGVTLIPTTVISLRMLYGSLNATGIILPVIIVTITGSVFGLILDYFMRRLYE